MILSVSEPFISFFVSHDCVTCVTVLSYFVTYITVIYNITLHFFLKKLTIYYTGYNGSSCLQEKLYMKYQYHNLFIQLPNTKDY